jgi:predicted TPR repeat methyltransferase
MLQKASEKNIYDDLIVFDILQEWTFPQPFDLIYSSDVFVYFGNLDPIIRSASSHLVHGGIIAFSVEKLEDDSTGYQLFPSGRYRPFTPVYKELPETSWTGTHRGGRRRYPKAVRGEVSGILIVAEKIWGQVCF